MRTAPGKDVSSFRGANCCQPAPVSVNFASRGRLDPLAETVSQTTPHLSEPAVPASLCPAPARRWGLPTLVTRLQLQGLATGKQNAAKSQRLVWGKGKQPPKRVLQNSLGASGPALQPPPTETWPESSCFVAQPHWFHIFLSPRVNLFLSHERFLKPTGAFSILAAGFSVRKSPRWGSRSTLAHTLRRWDVPSTQMLGHPGLRGRHQQLLVKFEGEVLVAAVQLWGKRLWVLGVHSQAVCREGEAPSGKPEAPCRPPWTLSSPEQGSKTSPGPSGGCSTRNLSSTAPQNPPVTILGSMLKVSLAGSMRPLR